ncbi:MAG: hypothetical protein IKT14_08080 [Clostridiales bacterium]|nr:hypothetical protein [Clostridiales bacterium]
MAGILFVIFMGLCIYHGKIKNELLFLQTKKEVTDLYLSRIYGCFDELKDKGTEFSDNKHDYATDLDLFGERSLFALYNISETGYGRNMFSRFLKGKDDIPQKAQDMVKDLLPRKDLLIDYQATAKIIKMDRYKNALADFSDRKKDIGSKKRLLYKALPCLWIVPVIMAVMGLDIAGAAVSVILLIDLVVWSLISAEYKEDLSKTQWISEHAEALTKLYTLLEKEEFKDPSVKELVSKGAGEGGKVSSFLKEISGACNLCSLRSQPIFALILNAVFPFDLFCADRIFRMAVKYGDNYKRSSEALPLIEALMCAAVPGLISKNSTFPEFIEDNGNISSQAYFKGQDICHPLLDPAKCVSNSIELSGNTALITGSNMSGKTTLIRTVGTMCVLAYMGSPVPASSVLMGRMKIVSSMRIVDSIEENMSTFKAELVRIGRIVEVSRENRPMLFLIDEIFRGTNSKDRTDGAMKVLEILDKSYITGLMTTHDYELCDKVSQTLRSIVYYHFSEKYNDNSIIFDYKLHHGISHESNAAFLMKLVGIE